MCDHDMQNSIKKLQEQLEAWENHSSSLGFHDRQRFVLWLAKALDSQELALIIDGEILRNVLWDIYLHEHFGA